MSPSPRLSARLVAVLNALPIGPDSRVLEIGCGPGALARAIAARTTRGCILAVDRSPRAIEALRASGAPLIDTGRLRVRCTAIEDLRLEPGDHPYDFAVACRVGVLDGRHPTGREPALASVRAALVPGGLLHLDDGDPLRAIRP